MRLKARSCGRDTGVGDRDGPWGRVWNRWESPAYYPDAASRPKGDEAPSFPWIPRPEGPSVSPQDQHSPPPDGHAADEATDGDLDGGPRPAHLGPPALSPGEVRHVDQPAYERGYFVLAVLFVSMLLLTNIIGTKLFAVPLDTPLLGPLLSAIDRLAQSLFGTEASDSLTLTAGIITYPLTFLITDIVSEVWGRRRADVMVLLGFAASLLMLVVITVAGGLQPSVIWNVPDAYHAVFAEGYLMPQPDGTTVANHVAAQAAYRFTFDAPGTLLFASMTAYLVAQLVDNRLFHFWRRLTKGKALWFRNNMSTGLSQLVDTIIVNGIFLHFYWKLPATTIMAVILNVYAVKFLLALIDTPLCYLGVHLGRRYAERDGTTTT